MKTVWGKLILKWQSNCEICSSPPPENLQDYCANMRQQVDKVFNLGPARNSETYQRGGAPQEKLDPKVVSPSTFHPCVSVSKQLLDLNGRLADVLASHHGLRLYDRPMATSLLVLLVMPPETSREREREKRERERDREKKKMNEKGHIKNALHYQRVFN